ncbi:hypothetical protein [Pollutimonas harenae]|uniref:Uncharacterized protein n=1 Tax=Pollutimonas harenae TaxID=657015 RepID=A0A853H1M4_9BURK|nr:hypothetical protein [Pollutimonas harenae]NYT84473.1 hypothetical protein [Pollutimonas harenae]TEA73129.1 hypothetical protein ERD84_04260 [Pollutimonas harenae]
MKPDSLTQQPTSQDRSLLRNTLLQLTAVQKIVCVVVIIVVALVWYDLLMRVVTFGHNIDYSGLHVLGVQGLALLNQYNPFFWWVVVALCTLIIAYFLYSFVRSTQRSVRGRQVKEEAVLLLANQLSEPACEVLRWAWQDRRDPITVGDLQRAYTELRSGRASKIALARRHAAVLDLAEPVPGGAQNLPSR